MYFLDFNICNQTCCIEEFKYSIKKTVSKSLFMRLKPWPTNFSVAVNTSPTLNHVDKTRENNSLNHRDVKVSQDLASVSPSTASSCSSIPTTTVMTMQQCANGGNGNGSITRYSQHLGKIYEYIYIYMYSNYLVKSLVIKWTSSCS